MEASVARIIDVNCNRCREALRVMEEYARFVQNDPAGTEAVKRVRHELACCIGRLPAQELLLEWMVFSLKRIPTLPLPNRMAQIC